MIDQQESITRVSSSCTDPVPEAALVKRPMFLPPSWKFIQSEVQDFKAFKTRGAGGYVVFCKQMQKPYGEKALRNWAAWIGAVGAMDGALPSGLEDFGVSTLGFDQYKKAHP